jgi:hypothetical protein
MLTDRKPKCQVLTDQHFGSITAQHEYSSFKHHKYLTQKTEVSKKAARTITKLLKLWPYRTTAVHSL